jgi:DNA modification methylase
MIEPIYTDDWVTLYHGDCLEVLPELGTVDHVITDPPYEAAAHTKGRRVLRGNAAARKVEAVISGARESQLPFDPIDETTRAAVSPHIASAKRWALVFCQAEGAHKWDAALTDAGHRRMRWCVWTKPDGQPQLTGDRPGMGYETIVVTHAKGRSRWNGGGRLGVFRHVKSENGSAVRHPHPTTKPLSLMRELVTLFTDQGETVLDPFAGSGTTGRACKDLGRKCILIEREAKYCEVIIRRMRQERLL